MIDRDYKRLVVYKENFLKSVRKNFKGLHGIRKLINKIKKMSPEELYDKTSEDENVRDIHVHYFTTYKQQIFNTWLTDFWQIDLDNKKVEEVADEKVIT